MEVAGLTLIKRLALIVDDGRITHVFYPVFPPDRNAGDVLAWLKENRSHVARLTVMPVRPCAARAPAMIERPRAAHARSAFTFANTLRNMSGVSTRVLVL